LIVDADWACATAETAIEQVKAKTVVTVAFMTRTFRC
jgi:hypothetical protein